MLPLSLLRTAQNHPMLVELKNGDTYNGRLESCDSWMNIKLKEVIWTSKDGDRFWKLAEIYIRGSSVKYMTIPDEVLDMVNEEEDSKAARGQPGRGGRSGPSRGRGGASIRGRGERGGGRAATGGRQAGRGAPTGRGAPGGRGGGRTAAPNPGRG